MAALIVAALTASAQGQSSVTLAWNPDAGTNIAGYKIYYGVASRTYTNTNNVGNVTNATISSLIGGTIYYFAATAVDTSGLESDYSTEVVYTNPAATAPTLMLELAGSAAAATPRPHPFSVLPASPPTAPITQVHSTTAPLLAQTPSVLQLLLDQREAGTIQSERHGGWMLRRTVSSQRPA